MGERAREKACMEMQAFSLAVRGGFEPPVRFNPHASLANWWFQPLTHLTLAVSVL